MKEIKITKGYNAIVDDIDYETLSKHNWCYADGYVIRRQWDKEQKRYYNIRMHRVIVGVTDSNILVDHINGNKLDNRRSNLRICTHTQNVRNSKKQINNTSGYKGTYHGKKIRKDGSYHYFWVPQIRVNNHLIAGGHCDTVEEAALQYNELAKKYFGEFAKLNEVII